MRNAPLSNGATLVELPSSSTSLPANRSAVVAVPLAFVTPSRTDERDR
jgi:hypothetical protein